MRLRFPELRRELIIMSCALRAIRANRGGRCCLLGVFLRRGGLESPPPVVSQPLGWGARGVVLDEDTSARLSIRYVISQCSSGEERSLCRCLIMLRGGAEAEGKQQTGGKKTQKGARGVRVN